MLMVFSGYLIVINNNNRSYFTEKSLKHFLLLYSKSKKNAKNFLDNLIYRTEKKIH